MNMITGVISELTRILALVYPLVNVYITIKSPDFMGKSTISMAMASIANGKL